MNEQEFIRRELKAILILRNTVTMISISFGTVCVFALILCIVKLLGSGDTAFLVRISIIALFLSVNKISADGVRSGLDKYANSLADVLNASDSGG